MSLADLPSRVTTTLDIQPQDIAEIRPELSEGGGNGHQAEIGAISEDATDLLNSMFDDNYMVGTDYDYDHTGAVPAVPSYDEGLYTGISRSDIKSSLSTALLVGMADMNDNEDEAAPPAARAELELQALSAVNSQILSVEDERMQRLNAQRELERRQRQELQPVSNIDKDRKFLLFGDDDDDDY